MALIECRFFSDALEQCMTIQVILPEQTERQIGMKSARRDGKCPTLYLLHGLSDDHSI